jgi:hypothetical protein
VSEQGMNFVSKMTLSFSLFVESNDHASQGTTFGKCGLTTYRITQLTFVLYCTTARPGSGGVGENPVLWQMRAIFSILEVKSRTIISKAYP